ncbi:MAG: tRNA (adenosine(37)-N6)-dimethylallyltransferase MiaA [Pseudomonadota bacterium]
MTRAATPTAVFIAGPTASGKSAVALELACAVGGEIVNADAMQIYRDLRILTARPGKTEEAKAPHHLYGALDAAERCSAGRWARLAGAAVREIKGRGAAPLLVGGTGLYFKALEEGLSPIPEVPESVREEARARLAAVGGEAFRAEVLTFDPAMARFPPGDSQRLVRAWEVHRATGEPLSEHQAAPRTPLLSGPIARVVIEPDREPLYAACDARLEQMLQEGGLEEAARLTGRGLDPNLPAMKALGVQEFASIAAGTVSRDEGLAAAKTRTRRYAKRQLTWFRGQTPDWPRAASPSEAVEALKSQFAGAPGNG